MRRLARSLHPPLAPLARLARLLPRRPHAALLAAAVALLAATPRLATAQGATEPGKACYQLVGEYIAFCQDLSLIYELLCEWTAGVGVMLCVVVDLIVLIGSSVGLPSPM